MTREAPGGTTPPPVDWSDLGPRVGSALVLVAAALATAWAGGVPFTLFWSIAAALVGFEWLRLVEPAHLPRRAGQLGAGIIVVGALAVADAWLPAVLAAVALAAVSPLLASPGRRIWDFSGAIYALALLLGTLALRRSPQLGFAAILWLFAVVWAADVCAYFAGRSIGGPKLWKRVSPKKTWSGTVGGALGGTLAGLGALAAVGLPGGVAVTILGFVIAVASEAGDLFESALKRHFGVKDSGDLIPGHGGLMDRLDGFIVAAALAALIGLARAPHDVARGLLVW